MVWYIMFSGQNFQNKVNTLRKLCILVFLFGLILGYPNREAAHEALKAVREFLDEHADKVIFCLVLL